MDQDPINIHLVDTGAELDYLQVPNVNAINLIASSEDDLEAAAKILKALSRLMRGEALVIWRGTNPL